MRWNPYLTLLYWQENVLETAEDEAGLGWVLIGRSPCSLYTVALQSFGDSKWQNERGGAGEGGNDGGVGVCLSPLLTHVSVFLLRMPHSSSLAASQSSAPGATPTSVSRWHPPQTLISHLVCKACWEDNWLFGWISETNAFHRCLSISCTHPLPSQTNSSDPFTKWLKNPSVPTYFPLLSQPVFVLLVFLPPISNSGKPQLGSFSTWGFRARWNWMSTFHRNNSTLAEHPFEVLTKRCHLKLRL